MRKLFVFLSSVLLLVACAQRKSAESDIPLTRSFPRVEIPAMIQETEERQEYLIRHFWDPFFQGDGVCDSLHVLGVRNEELEQNLSTYVALLHLLPVEEAQLHVSAFFEGLNKAQARDEDSLLYLMITDLVAKYLYDPNSPYRSEDLYLPFVEAMVESEYTLEDKLSAYKFQLEKCRINPYGTKAPDFKFKDIHGKSGTLHKVKGEYTMLFFSNPGCESCLDIIDEIQSRPYVPMLISQGKLSVVNIYIDYDLDSWKSYADSYPDSWINAYDFEHKIYEEDIYYVRAIPSLYLLDKEKRILLKDVPVERAMLYLEETLKI